MSDLKDRLNKIQQWIQQKDDELLYEPQMNGYVEPSDESEDEDNTILGSTSRGFNSWNRLGGISPDVIIVDEYRSIEEPTLSFSAEWRSLPVGQHSTREEPQPGHPGPIYVFVQEWHHAHGLPPTNGRVVIVDPECVNFNKIVRYLVASGFINR